MAVSNRFDTVEHHMQSTGLFTVEQMRPVNEMRMQARAKLGRALAAVERSAGPGRGKKMSRLETSFRAIIKAIGLDKNWAQEAQRIGSMLDNELEKKFAEASSMSSATASPARPQGP